MVLFRIGAILGSFANDLASLCRIPTISKDPLTIRPISAKCKLSSSLETQREAPNTFPSTRAAPSQFQVSSHAVCILRNCFARVWCIYFRFKLNPSFGVCSSTTCTATGSRRVATTTPGAAINALYLKVPQRRPVKNPKDQALPLTNPTLESHLTLS